MAQTKYSLKEQAWKLYDPLFTAHRAMYRKNVQQVNRKIVVWRSVTKTVFDNCSESQQAHTNYFKHLQKMNILDSGALESSVWPPFQSEFSNNKLFVYAFCYTSPSFSDLLFLYVVVILFRDKNHGWKVCLPQQNTQLSYFAHSYIHDTV